MDLKNIIVSERSHHKVEMLFVFKHLKNKTGTWSVVRELRKVAA